MAQLALVRIDARLIHGQVVTQWIKRTAAKLIIIVDNQIATDPFMAQIFTMAAPPGTKLENMTTDQAAASWKKDQFGNVGPVLVLMRNVPMMFEAFMKGFDFKELLVGGIGGAPGRINVHGPITLSEDDAKMLKQLDEKGVEIAFQSTLDEARGNWKNIKAKYYPNV